MRQHWELRGVELSIAVCVGGVTSDTRKAAAILDERRAFHPYINRLEPRWRCVSYQVVGEIDQDNAGDLDESKNKQLMYDLR